MERGVEVEKGEGDSQERKLIDENEEKSTERSANTRTEGEGRKKKTHSATRQPCSTRVERRDGSAQDFESRIVIKLSAHNPLSLLLEGLGMIWEGKQEREGVS